MRTAGRHECGTAGERGRGQGHEAAGLTWQNDDAPSAAASSAPSACDADTDADEDADAAAPPAVPVPVPSFAACASCSHRTRYPSSTGWRMQKNDSSRQNSPAVQNSERFVAYRARHRCQRCFCFVAAPPPAAAAVAAAAWASFASAAHASASAAERTATLSRRGSGSRSAACSVRALPRRSSGMM